MDFSHLKIFVAVSETLSTSLAARKLGMSQPAVSQQIKKLEERLNLTLFERDHAGMRLTTAGQKLVEEASASVDLAERAYSVASRMGAGKLGKLHIGFVDSALFNDQFRQLLTTFRELYPFVDLELSPMSVVDQLAHVTKGDINFAVVRGLLPPPSKLLKTVLLSSSRLQLVVRKDHPLAALPSISARNIQQEPIILTRDPPGLGLRGRIETWFLKYEQTPTIIQEVPETLAIGALVRAGVGVSILPQELSGWNIENLKHCDIHNFPQADLHIIYPNQGLSIVGRNFLRIAQSLACSSSS